MTDGELTALAVQYFTALDADDPARWTARVAGRVSEIKKRLGTQRYDELGGKYGG